ncbi:MAG: hypothetical protein N2647_01070 [Thermodesulfovibrio sp.]|nr:hypothetical protein [Thermodesulfovibrio sp.]
MKKKIKSFKPAICLILTIICLQLFLFFSSLVYAHKVNTHAYREGDKIFGECYFVDGSPCKNSKVEVYNFNGQKILETTTDEKGKYSFITKEKDGLKIVISAGEGHRVEYKIKEAVDRKEVKEHITKDKKSQVEPKTWVGRDEMKQIIDEVVDVKLKGLRNEIIDLRKQMDKINLRDIIGGIGYILGIWGIIMFIKRKKNAS